LGKAAKVPNELLSLYNVSSILLPTWSVLQCKYEVSQREEMCLKVRNAVHLAHLNITQGYFAASIKNNWIAWLYSQIIEIN